MRVSRSLRQPNGLDFGGSDRGKESRGRDSGNT